MIPIKNDDNISIMWDIPYIIDQNDHHIQYINSIIGSDAKNSLSYILKNMNWITSLYVGDDGDIGNRTILQVVFELTPDGKKNIVTIINLLFKYIEFIKKEGINESNW